MIQFNVEIMAAMKAANAARQQKNLLLDINEDSA
jgi:hypothetical protein